MIGTSTYVPTSIIPYHERKRYMHYHYLMLHGVSSGLASHCISLEFHERLKFYSTSLHALHSLARRLMIEQVSSHPIWSLSLAAEVRKKYATPNQVYFVLRASVISLLDPDRLQ